MKEELFKQEYCYEDFCDYYNRSNSTKILAEIIEYCQLN